MNLRDRSGIKRKSSFSYEIIKKIKDVQLPEEKVVKKEAEKRKKKRRRTLNKIWSLEEKKMMLDGILMFGSEPCSHLKIKRHFHMKKNLPEIQQFVQIRRQFSSQIKESHLHDWFSLNKILVDQVADYSVCLAQQFSKAVGWPAEDSKSQLDSSLNNDNNISINNINDRDNINSSGDPRSSSSNNNNIDNSNLEKLNIVQKAFNTGDKNATFIIKITNNPNTANNVNNNNISKNIKNSNDNHINKAYVSNTDINNSKNINSEKKLDSSTIWSNVYWYISATLNNTSPPELNQIESAIVLLLLENLLKNYQTLNVEHQMGVIRNKFNCLAPLLSLPSLSLPPHLSKSLSRSKASSSTSRSMTRDAVENVLVKALLLHGQPSQTCDENGNCSSGCSSSSSSGCSCSSSSGSSSSCSSSSGGEVKFQLTQQQQQQQQQNPPTINNNNNNNNSNGVVCRLPIIDKQREPLYSINPFNIPVNILLPKQKQQHQ